MKRKLRGIHRTAMELDFDLYRVKVPISGLANTNLSVIDIWPEGVEKTIMFVHGYAGCAETWEYQINHFSRTHRVIVPDLRGHGQSDAPFSRYTMSEMVSDLNDITHHLKLPEKFVLVGHSFGGSICLEYANAYQERLEQLVLVATAGEFPLTRPILWLYRLPTAFYRPLWRFRPRWNSEVHVFKRMAINNLHHWKAWPLLENIHVPTLVITGERDRFFPRYVFDDLSKKIPNAELYDIGGAKHKVQLERHQAVNRAIERFVHGRAHSSWRDQPGDASGLLSQRVWLGQYGPHTRPTVPIPRQPLHRFLESAADWFPKKTAIIFYGARLTYKQLEEMVNQFAHALHGLGVQPGDRVMVVLPNVPQLIVAFYGTLKIGGVVVLPNPEAGAAEIVEQVRHTEATVLVTLRDFSSLAQRVLAETDLQTVVLADLKDVVSAATFKKLMERWQMEPPTTEVFEAGDRRWLLMPDMMQDAITTPLEVPVSHNDMAVIVYTSGTTGTPKGVCLSHSNLVANTMQTRHWIQNMRYGEEVCLAVVPLLHSYGMTTAMNVPIALGATIVLLPVFELAQVMEQIKATRPTILPGVPAMYAAISHAPNVRAYGLESIKACVSGATPLPVEVQEAFEKLTGGALMEGYGLTEASPVTHGDPLSGKRKVGSIGLPIPNTDARIVDLVTGAPLPPRQVGELCIKGPQVMQGYWRDPEATDEALKDGWLFTGDLATMDREGYFRIISRKRDTIMAGDFSVYPRDVEEVLYENNKVLEVAVVGVPDGNGQERVTAFVVPRPGSELSEQELLDLCRRRLDEYAVPWNIEFREELPKSFIGKILRRTLVDEGD
jgi:long-chain acyl-CoA synthetase